MPSLSPTQLLLPYQSQWIADISPVRVIEKSRRIGITWAEAADSALKAAANHGCDTWYISVTEDSAREFITDVAFWAKAYQLALTLCKNM